jgi:hypothetical protein
MSLANVVICGGHAMLCPPYTSFLDVRYTENKKPPKGGFEKAEAKNA